MSKTPEEAAKEILAFLPSAMAEHFLNPNAELKIESRITEIINEVLLTSKEDRKNIIYESGIYFGFPKCCILEYIEDVTTKNYDRIQHRLSLVRNGVKGRLDGFVPCMQHCIEISTELVIPESLITERVCPLPYKTLL